MKTKLKSFSVVKSLSSIFLVTIQFSCIFFLVFTGTVINLGSNAFLLELTSILLGVWSVYAMRTSKLNIFPELRLGSILIRKGPYRIIRHPMYLAVILFAISMLLNYFTLLRLLIVLVLVLDLVIKIEYEETLLEKELTGYIEYRLKTYKLIPYIY